MTHFSFSKKLGKAFLIINAFAETNVSYGMEDLRFTYLDLIDPSIKFQSVMHGNKAYITEFSENESLIQADYSIFGQKIPGYEGSRCIIEYEMALELKKMQEELHTQSPYALKVFDTYRPQAAVDYLGRWIQALDDQIVKKYHYPNVNKCDFHKLSYIAQKSSHSLGTAIDLTLTFRDESNSVKSCLYPEGFLGLFDPLEVDMGNVGYLAFDERSSHETTQLNDTQKANRKFLLERMENHGFQKLRSEFWHYFYKRDRNRTTYFNFPIKDDYLLTEAGTLVIE